MNTFRMPRLGWMLFVAVLAVVSLVVVFRLGNQASAGVSLNDPVVWIEDGARGRILQINGSTREITAAVRVGDPGDSLTAIPRGRDAVFLNKTTGELGVIGAVSLAIDSVEEIPGTAGPLTGEHLQILADLRVSTDAFILDSERTLVYEPGGAGERLDIPTPGGLGDTVVDAEGQLLAVTMDADRVGITTDRGLAPLVSLAEPLGQDSQPPGLARAGNAVYVVDAARRTVNEIVGPDELGPTTCVAGSLSDVRIGGNVLTTSEGVHRVLVHDSAAGILSVTEPGESDCFQIEIGLSGDQWGDPVAVDSIAYLPNFETGEIVIVDLSERVVLDTVRFGLNAGRAFELEVFDGAVWANEPQGTRAAIVRPDEILQISKIRAVRVSENADEAGDDLGGIVGGAGSPDRVFGTGGEVPGAVGTGDPASTNPEDIVDGGENPTDGELVDGEIPQDLVDSPIVVDVVETPDATLDELVANFDFSADTVNVDEEVSFTDKSLGEPNSWNWDFGDGTGADGPDVTKVWESEGIFTVTLFVANASGAQAQQSLDITVVADDVVRVPTADFSFQSATVEVGETIEFVDESTGDADTLLWDFGDGATATGPIATHIFTEPGSYEVSLTASNEAGPSSSSAVITVVTGVKAPEAIIGRFPGVIEVGQTVTLTSESTNSPTAVSWGFGDGDSALGTQVRHSWKSAGTYRIRLSVSNSAAADETFADIVVEPRVNPPVARFGQSSLEAVQGEVISFNDLSLNNPTTLTWEFGDGSSVQGKNVTHTWDEPGAYTVTLTAQNEAGTNDVAKTVTIIPLPPNPPKASFSIASATVPVNSVVRFTDTSTGDPTKWEWDFGDGTSSVAKSPPHGYSSPGTYVVTLKASNAGGSDTISKTLIVVNPPTASFTRTISELVVSFTGTSTNVPTQWAWNFGDGTSSAAQNPVKTYTAAGTYSVTLIASNSAGSSAPFTATVQVAMKPTASFSVVTGGLTAQFTDTSTNGPAFWSWDFGDGTTSTVQSPTHTYAAGGTYPVMLTVSNAAGSGTKTTPVTVMLAPPNANFTCQVVGGGVACDGTTSTGAATFSWSGPGSVTSSGLTDPTVSFTYATSGSYDITLTVANAAGTPNAETQTVTVTVPQPPGTPNITLVSNNNGVVQLSATATNGPVTWSWNAGGAPMTGGTTANPTITYSTGGQKTVTATATNGVGSTSNSITFTVTVTPPPVVTNIAVNSNGPNGIVSLTGTASNSPSANGWTWSTTGGGTISNGSTASPTISYSTSGSKMVTATASNAGGTSSPVQQTFMVTITPPPVVTNIAVNSNGPNGIVSLTGTASNSPSANGWTWSTTGGGTISNGSTASPTISYSTSGSKMVTATASNAGGTSSPVQQTFMVTLGPPDANFTVLPTGVQIDVTGVAQLNTTYAWTFGDGASGTGQMATHTYGGAGGTFNVTLTVTRFGLTNSMTKSVTVP